MLNQKTITDEVYMSPDEKRRLERHREHARLTEEAERRYREHRTLYTKAQAGAKSLS